MKQQSQSIQWTLGLFMPFGSCHLPSNTNQGGTTYSSGTAMAVPVFRLDNLFSSLRNLPAKLLIEIAKPKMTALGCTPLIIIHPSCMDVG